MIGNPRNHLDAYIKNNQVWVCPSRSTLQTGYWLPEWIENKSMAAITEPTNAVMVSEAAYWLDQTWKNSSYPAGTSLDSRLQTMSPKHSDGINIGWADGHVKWSRLSQLTWSQYTQATSGSDLTTAVGRE